MNKKNSKNFQKAVKLEDIIIINYNDRINNKNQKYNKKLININL